MDEDDDCRARANRIAAARLLAPVPEISLEELYRIKVENLRDIVSREATKQAVAKGVSPKQRNVLEANRDLLDIRVTEMLDKIAELTPSYQCLRMLACVHDVMAGAFRIGAKGEANEAIERALAKARDQTAPGRSKKSIRASKRRDRLRPHVQRVLAENPSYDPSQVRKALLRLPRSNQPKELWDVERTQQKKDIAEIMREPKAPHLAEA
jgi:hypothetical protein